MSRNFKLLLLSIFIITLGTYGKEWIKESRAKDASTQFVSACIKDEKSEGAIPAEKLQVVCSCTADGSLKRLGYERFAQAANQGVNAAESDIGVLKSVFKSCVKQHVN